MFIRLACSLVLLIALMGNAFADLPGSPRGRAALGLFKSMDHDGDKGLSWAELQALGARRGADTLFALLDPRGDGRIRLADMDRLHGAVVLDRFRAYDVRHQGAVTRMYFPKFVDPVLFAALDRNHDGRLSLSELRPEFVGSRVKQAEVPTVRHHNQVAVAKTLPWVPVIGTHGTWLQMPVEVN